MEGPFVWYEPTPGVRFKGAVGGAPRRSGDAWVVSLEQMSPAYWEYEGRWDPRPAAIHEALVSSCFSERGAPMRVLEREGEPRLTDQPPVEAVRFTVH
ncbi:MAG: hypothetical protein ACFB9M_03520 [Myxococcota bacterium]